MKRLSLLLASCAAIIGVGSAFVPSGSSSGTPYDWHSISSGDTVFNGISRQSAIDKGVCNVGVVDTCLYATAANGSGNDDTRVPGETIDTAG